MLCYCEKEFSCLFRKTFRRTLTQDGNVKDDVKMSSKWPIYGRATPFICHFHVVFDVLVLVMNLSIIAAGTIRISIPKNDKHYRFGKSVSTNKEKAPGKNGFSFGNATRKKVDEEKLRNFFGKESEGKDVRSNNGTSTGYVKIVIEVLSSFLAHVVRLIGTVPFQQFSNSCYCRANGL